MKTLKLLMIVAVAMCVANGCGASRRVNVADEEAAIRKTDADWLGAATAHDLNRVLPFWADDATILTPDAPPVVGKEAIRKYVADSFAAPGFAIAWKTEKVEVAQAGDLAYGTGTNEITFNDTNGKPHTQSGRSVVIWKKQADGSWKCAVDIMTPAQAAK